MTSTGKLRRQHDAIVRLVANITQRIDDYRDEANAAQINLEVAKLLGHLRVHFIEEDLHLYPELIVSGVEEAMTVAVCFEQEMGDIAERFEEFVHHWSSSAVIASRFREFRHDALLIFSALRNRIRRENEILYPLAAAMNETARRAAA